jgi:GT2 family glycosyltransferase
VAYRRSRIRNHRRISNRFAAGEDYDLWFRCAKAGMRFANLPEALILHRFDETSHLRHAFRDALERAMSGYRGASLLGMPLWTRLACFVPCCARYCQHPCVTGPIVCYRALIPGARARAYSGRSALVMKS